MQDAIERAMEGTAAKPLTAGQRRLLMVRYIIPAHRAARARGLAGADLEGWRREEQFKACHQTHLRWASQADFPRLAAHFLRLQGATAAARRWELRAATGNPAVALAKLRQAMEEAEDAIEDPAHYAAAIARSRFGHCDLERLSERQLWTLVFDVRRAAGRRRDRGFIVDHCRQEKSA